MRESGYLTALTRLVRAELTGKSELLVGVPSETVGGAAGRVMSFPWKSL